MEPFSAGSGILPVPASIGFRSASNTSVPQFEHTENLASGDAAFDVNTEVPDDPSRLSENERRSLAQAATVVERDMTTKQSLSMYPFAIVCSFVLSLACVMEGYDLVLITGLLTFPAFRRDYQCPDTTLEDACEIPAAWQSAIVMSPQIGQILGVYLSGVCVEKYGYKRTFLTAMIALSAFIFCVFFSQNLAEFLAGMILCGIPWGVFQTLTTNYTSDVCPTVLRAYVTAWVNVCWIIGQLLGSVVLKFALHLPENLSYKIPLILQWAFPIPIFFVALLVPESPWWLVRHGKFKEARRALQILINQKNAPDDYTVEARLQMLIETNEEEKKDRENSGGTGYLDCFRGKANIRRTEITTVIWMIQNACGSALMAFSPYFFQRAGMPQVWAFNFVIIQYALGLAGTILSWVLINRAGRRPIEVGGLCALSSVLILIGIMSVIHVERSTRGYAVGSLLLFYTFLYGATIGPVTYSIVSELSSTRLKSRTINIARMSYNVVGIFNSVITPYQLNPTAWNWGAKTAWFWAGSCLFCAVYAYIRLPEVKGRTFGDIDWLFTEGIRTRDFDKTVVPLPAEKAEQEQAQATGIFNSGEGQGPTQRNESRSAAAAA